jgi:hypothetical protein
VNGAGHGRRTQSEGRRGRTVLAISVALVVVAGLSGCALQGGNYVDEPGVRTELKLSDGTEYTGTLVAYEQGALLVDREIARGENVRVIRKEGVDIAYVDDVPIGTAVEIRDFDIVVRERIPVNGIEEARVGKRALFGWGTLIAAAITFALVQVIQDQ